MYNVATRDCLAVCRDFRPPPSPPNTYGSLGDRSYALFFSAVACLIFFFTLVKIFFFFVNASPCSLVTSYPVMNVPTPQVLISGDIPVPASYSCTGNNNTLQSSVESIYSVGYLRTVRCHNGIINKSQIHAVSPNAQCQDNSALPLLIIILPIDAPRFDLRPLTLIRSLR